MTLGSTPTPQRPACAHNYIDLPVRCHFRWSKTNVLGFAFWFSFHDAFILPTFCMPPSSGLHLVLAIFRSRFHCFALHACTLRIWWHSKWPRSRFAFSRICMVYQISTCRNLAISCWAAIWYAAGGFGQTIRNNHVALLVKFIYMVNILNFGRNMAKRKRIFTEPIQNIIYNVLPKKSALSLRSKTDTYEKCRLTSNQCFDIIKTLSTCEVNLYFSN